MWVDLSNIENVRLTKGQIETWSTVYKCWVECGWPLEHWSTRVGSVQYTRWAVMFSLTRTEVHIELIKELSSFAFINALRILIPIRGEVIQSFRSIRDEIKLLRSDRWTISLGATEDFGINNIKIKDRQIKDYLLKADSTWIFDSPCFIYICVTWKCKIGLRFTKELTIKS